MIILDANILKGTSLRGPVAELLRAIRTSGTERVAAPWIAMEEIAAQQALAYEAKHNAAMQAMDALAKATPWTPVARPRKFDAEHVRNHWRERYAAIAEVLGADVHTYQEAMFREANLLAPCKAVNSGKDKTGARDAAIWLTAVKYAKDNPDETVYFISNNTHDFGNGSSFLPPMDEDLKGIEQRFVLFTALDDVVTRFATEATAAEDEVKELLATEKSRGRVAAAAERYRSTATAHVSAVTDTGDLHEMLFSGGLRAAVAVLDDVRDIGAYEIGGHKWCMATVRWLIVGRHRQSRKNVNFSWETRVLLSPTAPDKEITILRWQPMQPITPEDLPKLPTDALLLAEEIEELTRSSISTTRAWQIMDSVRNLDPGLLRAAWALVEEPEHASELERLLARYLAAEEAADLTEGE